ncbi:MAG: hypothetical protein M3Y52_01140 [Actinomycetota bacterium]|nr:hypothetical protein [Actinomycetota bacterium]
MSHQEPHAVTQPSTGEVMAMRGCIAATECSSDRPGHRVHLMQQRLAATTASKWVDVIVVGLDDEGFVTLAELGGETAHRVWHHDSLEGTLAVGEPVALHRVYGVLARGTDRFSIAYA